MSSLPEPSGQTGGINNPGTMNVGGDIVGRDKIIHGQSAEELVDVLEARGVVQTAETVGLQRHVIIMLAERLRPEERLDLDQAITELKRAVDIALDVIKRGERGTSDDALVNAVLARVAERIQVDDLDGGAGAIDTALAKLAAGYRRSQVALLEEGVSVDILRRDAVAIVGRIEMLVAVDQPTDRPAWLPEFRERYDTFQADGETKGVNFSLLIAIELARRMVATARDESERGTAAILLGNALQRLGERESSTARVEEAVDAFRAALQAWTRERVPLEWAGTQNNLGLALTTLGERDSGTARLEEAVDVFRAALQERTRERVPFDWATTQNNLGFALATLGERDSGTARLKEAVAAYRAALQEWTRERVPLDWAAAQNNLGSAFGALGARESSMTRVEEAVDAFRAALQEWTRARVPLRWAMTQCNLGLALATLGERDSGTARLEQAVDAFRAALQEWTRERVPLKWAAAQNNLDKAQALLNKRLGAGGV